MSYREDQPSRIAAIVLSDAPQAEVASVLRVSNEAAAWVQLTVEMIDNRPGQGVILRYPPGSVTFERGRFRTVRVTGSEPISATFNVFGYYDPPNP